MKLARGIGYGLLAVAPFWIALAYVLQVNHG